MNIINNSTKRAALPLSAVSFLLPQNGVVEGAVHYRARDSSSPQLPRPTMDSCNGNAAANSSSHPRPTALGVKNKNEHLNKSLREQGFDDADGSLPCTPEFQSEIDMDSFSAEDEVLESDTRQIIGDFLMGFSQSRWNQSPVLSTMKRVVENLLEKHKYAYNGMINKLSLEDRGDDITFVGVVAKNIFEDGTTNWGRIASLLAFGAVVCQYMKTKGRESCVETVGQEISTYLLSDQRDWLVRNNGWDGFVDFFRVDDPESKVRNTLMAVAGLAGIGATLAMLIR